MYWKIGNHTHEETGLTVVEYRFYSIPQTSSLCEDECVQIMQAVFTSDEAFFEYYEQYKQL